MNYVPEEHGLTTRREVEAALAATSYRRESLKAQYRDVLARLEDVEVAHRRLQAPLRAVNLTGDTGAGECS